MRKKHSQLLEEKDCKFLSRSSTFTSLHQNHFSTLLLILNLVIDCLSETILASFFIELCHVLCMYEYVFIFNHDWGTFYQRNKTICNDFSDFRKLKVPLQQWMVSGWGVEVYERIGQLENHRRQKTMVSFKNSSFFILCTYIGGEEVLSLLRSL